MAQTQRSGLRRTALISGVVAASLALSACETRVANRGHSPDIEDIAAIQPGSDTKEDILSLFGTPSSTAVFRNDTWYYIGQRVETYAFYKPEVTDRSVLVLTFDDQGVVTDTRYLTIYDSQEVNLVERITPTEGREFTLLEQLIGNFGRLPDSFGGSDGTLDRPF